MGWGSAGAALAGPGGGLRGLERRRQRGDHGARGGRRSRSRPSRSPRSTRRSSTTSRSPGRRSGSPRARPARSTGPRTRSSPPSPPTAERDLVLVSGIEPNLRWRTFAEAVLEVAERLGVEMVVTLGALLADVPHTRAGADHRPRLRPGAGRAPRRCSRSSYEGPTGIVGIVHDACRRRGLTSASLWAAVPHYVAAVPNPKAALALLRRLEGFTGIAIEASELEEAMERFETQVDRAVAVQPRDRGARPPARVRAGRRAEIDSRRRTCPPATRSPATSSASCASAPTSRGRADAGSTAGAAGRRRLRGRPRLGPICGANSRLDRGASGAGHPRGPATGRQTSRHEPWLRPRTPGRSGGSRTRSRSRATGGARSPGR